MASTKALAASLGYMRTRTTASQNHKAIKGSGTCPVCWAVFKTHASDGTLHRHGSRSSPCMGSDQPPVSSSTKLVGFAGECAANVNATPVHEDIQSTTSLRSGDSTSLKITQNCLPPTSSWSHPAYRGPLVKRIPRSARPICATLISDLIKSVVQQPADTEKWSDLLSFGSFILMKPKRGGNKRNIGLTKIIQQRVAAWQSGERNYVQESVERRYHTMNESELSRHRTSAVTSKLEEGNFKAAIRLICSDDRPAADSSETLAALRAKHPPPANDRRCPCNPDVARFDAIQISDKDILNAVRSFPAGSAGGPDGITPQHLKDLLATVTDDQLLHHLVQLVNLLLKGGLSQQISEIIFGANLLALQKKDGGLRPIAVGYTWRRLAAKCANKYAVEKLSEQFAPIQLGVGVPSGAEAAVHATRRYVGSMPAENVFVKLDFSNAFNTLRRDCMLEAVAKDLPEIYRFVHAEYSHASVLKFGTHSVMSEEGPQQGDPLGPTLFCMAIHPLLLSLKSELRIGFLDDISLGGPEKIVSDDITMIEAEASKLGLQLNKKKCEITSRATRQQKIYSEAFSGFQFIDLENLFMLGSPVMPGSAIDQALAEKINDLTRAISRLRMLQAHDALVILRVSLSIPKLMYTLRTASCHESCRLSEFDTALRIGLSSILNVDISDDQWNQASLPIKDGGLGIRSAASLATSAFLASAARTDDLQSRILPQAISTIQEEIIEATKQAWIVQSGTSALEGVEAFSQKTWDSRCIRLIKDNLLLHAVDIKDKARLLATQAPHSGDWLFATPVTAIGLKMSNETIRVAVGTRLGTRLCEPHTCPCGSLVDARGLHGLSCRRSAGRHARHSQLNDIIWRSLRRANIPASKEPLGLNRSDGKRPDGVTLIPWSHGKCLTWDVTVPDTMATSHIQATSTAPGAAADKAATNKRTKYAALQQTHLFVPVSLETLGPWNCEGLNFIKTLGQKLTEVTGDTMETSFLFQRLSVAVQRGNQISISATLEQNFDS